MTKAQAFSQRNGIPTFCPDPFARLSRIFKVRQDTLLTAREKACASALMYFANYSSICSGVRREEIAERMGCSVSTVYRAIKGLESKGIIEVIRKPFTRNIYKLSFIGE